MSMEKRHEHWAHTVKTEQITGSIEYQNTERIAVGRGAMQNALERAA